MKERSAGKKVLHIISGLSTGGAERALWNLLAGGLSKRFETAVIALAGEGAIGQGIREIGVPVHTLNMGCGAGMVSSVSRLRRIVKSFNPDLIQGWMYHGNLAASVVRATAQRNCALAWNVRHTLYGLDKEKFGTQRVIKAGRMLSSGPDTILYNSAVSREQHEDFGFPAEHGVVIPNGIDTASNAFSPSARHALRKELDIPADAFVFGHVARYHPMKNHRLFVESAIQLAEKRPSVYFVMIGKGVTSETNDLTRLIPDEIRYRFSLLGERNDVPTLMSVLDVLCSTSSWGEGFPNVLGEAMAAGVPCLTTSVGDSAYVVGDAGTVVPSDDSGAVLAAMAEFVSMPAGALADLRRQATERVTSNFALEMIVGRYTELYDVLLTA